MVSPDKGPRGPYPSHAPDSFDASESAPQRMLGRQLRRANENMVFRMLEMQERLDASGRSVAHTPHGLLQLMSRELRTPLSTPIGVADLTLEGLESPDVRPQLDHLAHFLTAARSLLTLLDEMLVSDLGPALFSCQEWLDIEEVAAIVVGNRDPDRVSSATPAGP